MTPAALGLVLAAAVLHAIWNGLAKGARDSLAFLWWAVTLGAIAFLPLGLWTWARTGLPASALPFVAATIALHGLYFFALGRAYRHGDFSRVYPIARGLGVALVPVIGLVAFDEHVSLLGATGIALVVAGALVLQAGGGSGAGAAPGAGSAWAVLTGVTIAAYSIVDKGGVMRADPVVYILLLGIGSSLLLAPVVLARPAALRDEWAANWRRVVAASLMNLSAYLLVLFAFRLSKVGYVVAARELSIVLSAVIGSRWLGEGAMRARVAAAGVVLAGVLCVALAR
jgi:drug/metabolite transporter (DMT)-like permease